MVVSLRASRPEKRWRSSLSAFRLLIDVLRRCVGAHGARDLLLQDVGDPLRTSPTAGPIFSGGDVATEGPKELHLVELHPFF